MRVMAISRTLPPNGKRGANNNNSKLDFLDGRTSHAIRGASELLRDEESTMPPGASRSEGVVAVVCADVPALLLERGYAVGDDTRASEHAVLRIHELATSLCVACRQLQRRHARCAAHPRKRLHKRRRCARNAAPSLARRGHRARSAANLRALRQCCFAALAFAPLAGATDANASARKSSAMAGSCSTERSYATERWRVGPKLLEPSHGSNEQGPETNTPRADTLWTNHRSSSRCLSTTSYSVLFPLLSSAAVSSPPRID